MLIDFRVTNHRSIRTEAVISFATRKNQHVDDRLRVMDGHRQPLSTVAGVYGANASGKSNLLLALSFMCDAALFAYQTWRPGEGVPRHPFKWGGGRQEPSRFEMDFLVGGVRHRYGFVLNDDAVLAEWLLAWPRGQPSVLLERDSEGLRFGVHMQGKGVPAFGRSFTNRRNVLFLSVANQQEFEPLMPVVEWFRRVRLVRAGRHQRFPILFPGAEPKLFKLLNRTEALIPDDAERRSTLSQVRDLIRAADVGFVDFVPDDDELMFRHRGPPDALLGYRDQSDGTKALTHFAPDLVEGLRSGGIVLVDELDSSLHPALTRKVVELFNRKATNPNNAQLFFNTHDTTLLGQDVGDPALARDQVWLANKSQTGESTFVPLSDYKPRCDVEKAYLQGRFGAVPYVAELADPS